MFFYPPPQLLFCPTFPFCTIKTTLPITEAISCKIKIPMPDVGHLPLSSWSGVSQRLTKQYRLFPLFLIVQQNLMTRLYR